MKKKFILDKVKKILPSKKFLKWTIILIGTALFIFLIFFVFSKKDNFTSKNGKLKESQTILGLVQTDTDLDGVPDWEEALWGTDKKNKMTFDGVPDSTYIENRKKELKTEDEQNLNATTETETDKFAKEFFSSYTALKDSGQDDNTITSFSNALGQKIVNPTLIDRFKEADAKIDPIDNSDERGKYYVTLKGLFGKYRDSGLGSELDIVTKGLVSYDSSGTATNYDDLLVIADGYQEFANEVMKVPVPKSYLQFHLDIANSANNTGISVFNMTKVINDPVVGLTGVSQYQKYSDEFVSAVGNLEGALDQ